MLRVRVPRSRPYLSLTFLIPLALVAALQAGCGSGNSDSGKKLSPGTSASLQGTLDRVEQDFHAGNCTAAAQEAASLRQRVESLTQGSRRTRNALASSSARLETLIADQCEPTNGPTTNDQGTTGTTGDQGTSGDQGATGDQGKKPKKEKPPKEQKKTPPGQAEGGPPGQQGNGGGAGLPGESNQNGGD
jgi:hypothetical protein